MSESNVRRNISNAKEKSYPSSKSVAQGNEPSKYYESARLGSLVPGIIHNLSTPLSGVVGGIQLLEMRSLSIIESIEKLEKSSDAQWQEILNHLARNQKNIGLVSRNARNLSDLLQILVERTSRFSIKSPDIYGLNQLVETELKFLEFNLTFKHRVRRSVDLADELPPLRCSYPIFVEVFEEIIYSVIELYDSTQDSLLEIAFQTSLESGNLVFSIDCSVELSHFEEKDSTSDSLTLNSRPSFQKFFERLRQDGWDVEMYASTLGTTFRLRHAPMRLASQK